LPATTTPISVAN